MLLDMGADHKYNKDESSLSCIHVVMDIRKQKGWCYIKKQVMLNANMKTMEIVRILLDKEADYDKFDIDRWLS